MEAGPCHMIGINDWETSTVISTAFVLRPELNFEKN